MQIYFPRPPLDQFITCFWFVELQVPYTREKILPTGTVELMINFGAPHRRYNAEETSFDLLKRSWIAGLQTGFLVNEPVAETCMIGVRFKPGGAHAFLDIPLSEITNFVIDMDCLWGNFIDEVRERLLALPCVSDKFALLEQILKQRMQQNRSDLANVLPAVRTIFAANGSLSVKELSTDIGVSQKHLINQFKKSVGVSPKQLSRIHRFQMVLNKINPITPIDWRDIAYACHFYDQSHFNHEFASFTGMSPTEYVIFRQSMLSAQPQQGEGVHFVPIIG